MRVFINKVLLGQSHCYLCNVAWLLLCYKWLFPRCFKFSLLDSKQKSFKKKNLLRVHVRSYCGSGWAVDGKKDETPQPDQTGIRDKGHRRYLEAAWIRLSARLHQFLTGVFHLPEDLLSQSAQCFRIDLDANSSPHCFPLTWRNRKQRKGRLAPCLQEKTWVLPFPSPACCCWKTSFHFQLWF